MLQSLDIFRKVPKDSQYRTTSGALTTFSVLLVLGYLLIQETLTYLRVQQKYEFVVDKTTASDYALQINFDITVKIPCDFLRADVFDIAGESIEGSAAPIRLIKTDFDSYSPKKYRSNTEQKSIEQVDNEAARLNVKKLLRDSIRAKYPGSAAKSGMYTVSSNDYTGVKDAVKIDNACQIIGYLNVNKLSGMIAVQCMLHITASGHGYFGVNTDMKLLNFTHRIDTLSFGTYIPGLTNPLDNTIKFTDSHLTSFQYFLSVVPTLYRDSTSTFGKVINTNQFSATEFQRKFKDERIGGVPGIFFKYSIEPISVHITAYQQGFFHWITRLCGLLGGVFVTCGLILSFIRTMMNKIIKNEDELGYKAISRSEESIAHSSFSEAPTPHDNTSFDYKLSRHSSIGSIPSGLEKDEVGSTRRDSSLVTLSDFNPSISHSRTPDAFSMPSPAVNGFTRRDSFVMPSPGIDGRMKRKDSRTNNGNSMPASMDSPGSVDSSNFPLNVDTFERSDPYISTTGSLNRVRLNSSTAGDTQQFSPGGF